MINIYNISWSNCKDFVIYVQWNKTTLPNISISRSLTTDVFTDAISPYLQTNLYFSLFPTCPILWNLLSILFCLCTTPHSLLSISISTTHTYSQIFQISPCQIQLLLFFYLHNYISVISLTSEYDPIFINYS